MHKFSGSVNYFDSHKKSSQSDLLLDKLWVTQCGWIWLCTTVSMGMTITNFWRLFCYGVKRDHYEKLLVSGNSWNDLLLITSRKLFN